MTGRQMVSSKFTDLEILVSFQKKVQYIRTWLGREHGDLRLILADKVYLMGDVDQLAALDLSLAFLYPA